MAKNDRSIALHGSPRTVFEPKAKVLHYLAGCCRWFNQCSVLPSNLIHLHDRSLDSLDGAGWFAAGCRHFRYDVTHGFDDTEDFFQVPPR